MPAHMQHLSLPYAEVGLITCVLLQTPAGEVPTETATGINTFTYFVCNHLGGDFIKLPDVTPKQIKAARKLKKLVTGECPFRSTQ